jgi:hypothetical protein
MEYNLAYLLRTCFYILEYSGAIEGQWLFLVISNALYANNVSIYCSIKEYLF